jgi:hypothetical protein
MESDTIVNQRRAPRQRTTRKDVSKFWDRVRRFERENIEAAEIILRNVGRYGGEGAGVVLWARLVLSHDVEQRRAA